MACIVRVHLGYCGVGVVVLWSVELCFGVLEFVYLHGSSVGHSETTIQSIFRYIKDLLPISFNT